VASNFRGNFFVRHPVGVGYTCLGLCVYARESLRKFVLTDVMSNLKKCDIELNVIQQLDFTSAYTKIVFCCEEVPVYFCNVTC